MRSFANEFLATALIPFLSVCGVAQSVTASPSSLGFSNQIVGTSSPAKNVILKNGQSVALTITQISLANLDYAETSTCPVAPAKLAAGASCTISVSFTPTDLGTRTTTLSIADSATSSPQNVALSGVGILAVKASPLSISYGDRVIGKKSGPAAVQVGNNQTVPLTISSISTDLADFSTSSGCPTGPNTLAAGATCTISVFFTPHAAGTRSAILTVNDNARNSPQVSLNGAGVLAAVATPTSLLFGNTAEGTTSASQNVTFTNNQSSVLTINSIASNSKDFGMASTCPISPNTLAAGANCTTLVSFSPKGTGARAGTLIFRDSANNTPQSVSLSGTGQPPNLVSIAVSLGSTSIPLGSTRQFAALGTYTDGSTQDLTSASTWNSSSPQVASISTGGLVTSAAIGSTNITATSGSISGSANVAVTPPALASIAVSPANSSIALGTNQQFAATGTFTDGSTQDLTTAVYWNSVRTLIATVSNTPGTQGQASSVTLGSCIVSAALGSITGTTNLTVSTATLVSIATTPSSPSIALGTTQLFKATGSYTDGSIQDISGTVEWSADTPDTATISNSTGSQGLARGLATGTATISARSPTVAGSTSLTVTPAVLISIAVSPANPLLTVGSTQTFSATATFSDGSTQVLTNTVTWSSDNSQVAMVDSTGLATAISAGGANMGASFAAVTGSAVLTVTSSPLASIAVLPQSASLPLGTTQQFSAIGTFSDGSSQDVTTAVHWSSSDRTVTTVSDAAGKYGLASTLATGDVAVIANSDTITGNADLTVTAATLVAIAISPQSASIQPGTSQQFTATGTFTDGSTPDMTTAVTWRSSLPGVAVISNDSGSPGLATTAGLGATTISATWGSISTSIVLSVQDQLLSITIMPSNALVVTGGSQQFTATGTFAGGLTQDVTNRVLWNSSSAAVATITAAGLAESVEAGPTTISASSGSAAAATILTVATDPLGAISNAVAIVCPAGKRQGKCYDLTVSCPNISDLHAYLKVSMPPAPTGTVVYATGGNGTTLLEATAYGTVVLDNLVAANYTIVQLAWGGPFANQPSGWQTGPGGIRAVACRPATVIKWAYDNLRPGPATPLCAGGNSAGSEQVGLGLAHYGLGSILSMAELLVGPPFAREDYSCECIQLSSPGLCSSQPLPQCVGLTNAEKYLDPAYAAPLCSQAVQTNSTANDSLFLSDSILSPDATLSYPKTYVHFAWGGQDPSSANLDGEFYIQAITSNTGYACVADSPHDILTVVDGAQQIATDFMNGCH